MTDAPLTRSEIERQLALCETMPPEPWEPEIGTAACCVLDPDRRQVAAALGLDIASFIAAARTALPRALREVLRLQDEVEYHQQQADKYRMGWLAAIGGLGSADARSTRLRRALDAAGVVLGSDG